MKASNSIIKGFGPSCGRSHLIVPRFLGSWWKPQEGAQCGTQAKSLSTEIGCHLSLTEIQRRVPPQQHGWT